MDSGEEEIIFKCRICDASVTDGDFVPLFSTSCHIIEKTYSGELFEELIQLSTEDTAYPYICNGCDLQMKLFKRLKDKAWKRLATKANTEEISLDTPNANETSQFPEAKKDTNFLDANNIVCEEDNENLGSSNNLTPYFENTVNENQLNDAEQTRGIENNDFLIVYNIEGQTLQSVNIDDLIELENSEKRENCNISVNKGDYDNFVVEVKKCNEKNTGTSNAAEAGNRGMQTMSAHNDFNGKKKSIANRSKSYKIECVDCDGLFFSSRQSFKAHRQEQHGRSHICKVCRKFFKTSENLEGHKRKHLGLAPYECEACKKTFNQKVHYQYHMKRHTNQRDFACKLCSKSYLNKSDLTMHIKRAHEGEKNFICSFPDCGKRFYFEQHLKYHSYVHSGERNFECDICRQRFVAPNALALHKRTIHSAGIKFACSQCGKTFRRKHHLEAHSSVHACQTESINSRGNSAQKQRKIKILKTNVQIEFASHTNAQRFDSISEIDESTIQSINEQSEDNDFLMDVIESCSETDNQNESDNYN